MSTSLSAIRYGRRADAYTSPEVAIRIEDDFLPFRYGSNNLWGVRAGATDVRQGLDLCGTVHVRNHRRRGESAFQPAETVRINHACHGATSPDLRQDHFPLRCQDVGGLRHEVHPTEDDDICVRLRRLLAQTQRISHIIRYFLDLTSLVVMGEYDGVLPVRQRPNLLLYS